VNDIGAGTPAPVSASTPAAKPPPVPYGDRLLRRMDSVRVRLAALVLLAAIPLLMLSATIAWQNYQLALDASRQTVVLQMESAKARHAAAIEAAKRMLQSLSKEADLLGPDIQACNATLAEVLALQPERYSNVVVFDAGGQFRCGGHPLPVDPPTAEARTRQLFALVRQSRGFELGPVLRNDRINGPVIPAIVPIMQNNAIQGFVAAGMRMDWFAGTEGGIAPELLAVWIADPAGELTQLATAGPETLPPPALLRALLGKCGAVQARSVGGAPYAYAAAGVSSGFHLLVAYPAAADQARARHILLARALQLAILLALGLAAVALGTHRALVHPLKQLGDAVEDWRRGGSFTSAPLRTPPREVRDLALSFAEATRSLAEQSEKLRLAAEKQDLLIREIHHRVKNNLQIVASLLNLQASRIRLPEARAEFASARDRVRALATLHRHLYSEGELSSINMRSFLKELCGQLFDAMGERLGGRISLTIEATELELSSDQAVPLSLIVTEAVSNALKYAFPNGRAGHVAVFLSAAEGMATIVIQDDGVGIPAGRAETETGTRDGLGIQLIRGFSKQLHGTLDVHEDGGTTYRVTFPLAGTEPAPPEEVL
jgi:two-component sensor histidine kinase